MEVTNFGRGGIFLEFAIAVYRRERNATASFKYVLQRDFTRYLKSSLMLLQYKLLLATVSQ